MHFLLTRPLALANLPSSVREQVIAWLNQVTPVNGTNPWQFDLGETLQLSQGCASFQTQVADALKAQLNDAYWTDLLTNFLDTFSAAGFDTYIQQLMQSRASPCLDC